MVAAPITPDHSHLENGISQVNIRQDAGSETLALSQLRTEVVTQPLSSVLKFLLMTAVEFGCESIHLPFLYLERDKAKPTNLQSCFFSWLPHFFFQKTISCENKELKKQKNNFLHLMIRCLERSSSFTFPNVFPAHSYFKDVFEIWAQTLLCFYIYGKILFLCTWRLQMFSIPKEVSALTCFIHKEVSISLEVANVGNATWGNSKVENTSAVMWRRIKWGN